MKDTKILLFVLFGNILLMGIKIAGGIYGHSAALVADGIHSGADVVATLLILFAVRLSLAPPDEEHPYGHGKVEPLAATGSAILLGFIALEIIYSGTDRIINNRYTTPDALTAWIASTSILLNEIMFRFENKFGKERGSTALVANAWDNRSDAFSSLAALLGIIAARLGFLILDPISALIIAVMIIRIAYRLIIKSSLEIMDTSIPEIESAVVNAAERVEGIEHAYARARRIGRQIHVDLKLEMDSLMTVSESHLLGVKVKEKVSKRFVNIEQIMIHVHPHEET